MWRPIANGFWFRKKLINITTRTSLKILQARDFSDKINNTSRIGYWISINISYIGRIYCAIRRGIFDAENPTKILSKDSKDYRQIIIRINEYIYQRFILSLKYMDFDLSLVLSLNVVCGKLCARFDLHSISSFPFTAYATQNHMRYACICQTNLCVCLRFQLIEIVNLRSAKRHRK